MKEKKTKKVNIKFTWWKYLHTCN